jgi:hypothetical protein
MNTGTRKMQARMIKRKKEFVFKPTLGMIGMVSTALHMKLTIVLAFSYPSTLTLSVVAMLMFPLAFMFGALLLLSLRRFKGAGIELEPAPFIPETIKFGPSLDFLKKSLRALSPQRRPMYT